MSDRRLTAAVAALVGALALLGAPPAFASTPPRSFTIGFSDSIYESVSNPNVWLDRTMHTGAQFVLLSVNWAAIAPNRPAAGSDPSNPANPAYNWGSLDQTVRAAVAHHLTVAFTIAGSGGPAWNDGPHRPSNVPAGTWRPNAKAFGAFAKAVARRYSGSFTPQPSALSPLSQGTGPLPHVRYYQGWGEPNLNDHLAPQWVRVQGHWVAESPLIYRNLLNAFYAGVKSVNSSDVVVSAGTAPFGDPPGGARIPPAEFVRDMLCLTPKLKPKHCPNPAHFDILAHHPYDFGGPYQKAYNRDDVTLPDLWKLERPLAAAERDGLALPRAHKPVWVTEFSWDTDPPNPHGVPVIKRAYWIEETFHELWREGVSAIAWYLIVDQPPIPNYGSTYQSGMYFQNGTVKPGLEGFRFPFLAVKAAGGKWALWGISPVSGTVLVQQKLGGHWRTRDRLGVHAHAVFTRTVSLSKGTVLRASIGQENSLTWHVQ